MPEATCKTCPWWVSTGGGVCRLLPPVAGRSADDPKALPQVDGEEDWCSAHPERRARVCLECVGTGVETVECDNGPKLPPWTSTVHCPACSGTGKVVPQ